MNDSRNGNQITEQAQQQRDALRILNVLFGATSIITTVYFFLAWQLQSWQILVMAILLLAFGGVCLYGRRLTQNGRVNTAMNLVSLGMIIIFPLSSLLISGLGLILGISLVGIIFALTVQALPTDARARIIFLSILSSVLTIMLDQSGGDYRLALPALQPFVGALAGGVLIIYAYFIIQNFSDYNLRTKLVVSLMFTAGTAVLVLGLFVFTGARTLIDTMKGQLQTVVRADVEETLNNIVIQEAAIANQTLTEVSDDVAALAVSLQDLLAQESILGQGNYWDARQELTRLPTNNSWDNDNDDIASVYMPADIELADSLISELNATKYLDFNAPNVLDSHTNVVAVYFINPAGSLTYYPNADLAAFLDNFDSRSGTWYTSAVPDNNPNGESVWTEPYQDPALTGLLVTASTPVYDNDGQFRGVVSADVQLDRITEQVSQIQVGQTGYAFLIDEAGRFIAMPEAGYQDLGLTPEEVPVNEVPQQTILGYGPSDLQNVTNRMVANESGLTTIEINDVERYVAFTPLPSTNFSLGVIVPAAEMNTAFISANRLIDTTVQNTLGRAAISLGIILLIAFAISLFVGRLITNPVEQLQHAAQQIAAGNLNVKADVQTGDEIGTLATTFNDMTDQLQRSVGQLDRRNRAIETSTAVGRQLSTILDPQRLTAEVVQQVQQAFNYYHAHIYLLDESGQTLNMAGGTGEAGSEMLASGHTIPLGKGLVGRAAATQETVLVADVSQEAGWLPNPLLPETKSEAAVPIMRGDELLGVLDVQHNVVDGLRQLDIEMLQTVANQVAIGLRNARSLAQAQQSAEQEHIVNEISQKIENATTIEDVLNIAARELRQTIGAKHTIVELSNPSLNNLN